MIVAIGYLVPGLLAIAAPFSAHAIVTRHNVPASRYLVPDDSFPALVDLPMEGQGVLIANQWVVTAAHATSMMRTMPHHDYVTVGGKRRQVARIILYPDYLPASKNWDDLFKKIKSEPVESFISKYSTAKAGMHDIALIELAEPIDDVTPVALYRGSAERGKVAELYGKGATGTDLTGAPDDASHRGSLRRAFNRIAGARGQWLSYVFDCDRTAVPLEGTTAGGDSGGPVLVREGGQWKLAGLAHGLDGTKSDLKRELLLTRSGKFRLGTCGQRFISSRISFYAPWIDKVVSGSAVHPE